MNSKVSQFSSAEQYLENIGLTDFLAREEVTDIFINKPYEMFVETLHSANRITSEKLSYEALNALARTLCRANNLNFSVSTTHSVVLPRGERGQIILPPAVKENTLAFAIRKPSNKRINIKKWSDSGRLSNFKNKSDIAFEEEYQKNPQLKNEIRLNNVERKLLALTTSGQTEDFVTALKIFIEEHLNIVIVGATGSGKTMFSKALADMIDPGERIITIEDVHELDLPYHQNCLHLIYKEGVVSAHDLLFASLRLKPRRILITEIRSEIAWDYITALNTGHPGGITSVHANSAPDVFNRIATLAKESETARNLDYDFLLNTAKATIDVILFFERTYLKEIYYNPYQTKRAKQGF